MPRTAASRPAHRQHGVALIVALILLMVLTMVAVIAMRTTTLDLKITTNQTLMMRTFQVSEAARLSIHDVIDGHTFHRGWPVAVGGDVPASSGFVIPNGILVLDDGGLPELYLNNNADPWDLTNAAIDLQLRLDREGDGAFDSPLDMAADLFISRVASAAAPGSDTRQASGYEGLGAGAAGAGALIFYRFISRAAGAGSSRALTEAHYRYVITN